MKNRRSMAAIEFIIPTRSLPPVIKTNLRALASSLRRRRDGASRARRSVGIALDPAG